MRQAVFGWVIAAALGATSVVRVEAPSAKEASTLAPQSFAEGGAPP